MAVRLVAMALSIMACRGVARNILPPTAVGDVLAAIDGVTTDAVVPVAEGHSLEPPDPELRCCQPCCTPNVCLRLALSPLSGPRSSLLATATMPNHMFLNNVHPPHSYIPNHGIIATSHYHVDPCQPGVVLTSPNSIIMLSSCLHCSHYDCHHG